MELNSESERFKDFIASIGGVAIEWSRLELELHGFTGHLLFGDLTKGFELFVEVNAETFLKQFARIYFSIVNVEECDIIFSNLFNRIKIVKGKRNSIIHSYWEFISESSVLVLTKGEASKEGHKKNKKIISVEIEQRKIEDVKDVIKEINAIREDLESFKLKLIDMGIIVVKPLVEPEIKINPETGDGLSSI